MATIRSTRPERDRYPSLLTRISNQVGRPWMLEGKKFLPTTGMPMRKMAFMSRPLALAEPVPFTLAILMTKSLTRLVMAQLEGWGRLYGLDSRLRGNDGMERR